MTYALWKMRALSSDFINAYHQNWSGRAQALRSKFKAATFPKNETLTKNCERALTITIFYADRSKISKKLVKEHT